MPTRKSPTTNGWSEYQKLVLFRLDQQDSKFEQLVKEQDAKFEKITRAVIDLKVAVTRDQATSKVKFGIIAAISGLISTGIFSAIVAYLF